MPRKSYSDAEREQIKERLLDAITESIATHTLAECSIDMLCEKAGGISKTYFYTLFPSKHELTVQALRRQQPRLLQRAQALMDGTTCSWRQGVEQFVRECCYGKGGIAILSIEEEQALYRNMSEEDFQLFRREQLLFFSQIVAIFGVRPGAMDPRLLGNLAIATSMVYQAIPGSMPFLFPEVAGDMVEFQIQALVAALARDRRVQGG